MTTYIFCAIHQRQYPIGITHCLRCGRHHDPVNYIHPGDCSRCKSRPVSKKHGTHAIYCDECADEVATGSPEPVTPRIFG